MIRTHRLKGSVLLSLLPLACAPWPADSPEGESETGYNCGLICEAYASCHPNAGMQREACRAACVKRVKQQKLDPAPCEKCVDSCFANCPALPPGS